MDGSTVSIGQSAAEGDPVRRRRRRIMTARALIVVVPVVGLALTISLALLTQRSYQRNERRLLALQTRLTADAIASADPLYVQDHLGGAVRLAAATDGDAAVFAGAMRSSVTARGPFSSAVLWHLTAAGWHQVTGLGKPPLLASAGGTAPPFVRQAATSSASFLVRRLSSGRQYRLCYAITATGPGGRYVAYAEEPLPASKKVSVPRNSPISELNFAVYLGSSRRPGALLEADTTAALPLLGTTYSTTIPFGNTVLTLTMSPRSSFAGPTSEYLPLGIVIGGLLIVMLATLATRRLVRGRERAERQSSRVGELYLQQRSVAETLQSALLPQQLPAICGMDIAVRYLAGASGVDVGGDWYDVVPLDSGRFIFLIGDVSGRGVRAAAAMASLHYASRAYAIEGHPPALVLANLARTLRLERDGRFATVLCGLVDVPGHKVALASAGHLPPLLRQGDRADVVAVAPGPPIGIGSEVAYQPVVVTTGPASTLVAYTDGLVERRGESLDAGLDRLARAAAGAVATSADDLLTGICTELTGDQPADDDIALIGLRWLN